MNISRFIASPNKFDLSSVKTGYTGKYKSKMKVDEPLLSNIERMSELQDKLFAQDKYALLVIFQGMDTAGKDGVIKHVMTGLNPQATNVFSFKQPSVEENNHDYLWRISKCLPEKGHIGIFNRSYYEEVLVVRVHNLIVSEKIPADSITDGIWDDRYRQFRNFEQYLFENGVIPVKIFLHISKEEQKKRLLDRIQNKSKNWKISAADIEERSYWEQYQNCYQEVLKETSTKHAPWYVVPSDRKWFSRLVVSEIIVQTLEKLKLEYPAVSEEQQMVIDTYREKLLND